MKLEFYQSRKDYVNASLIMLYRRPFFYVASIVLFFYLLYQVTMIFLEDQTPDHVILPVVMLVSLPLITISSARRSYRSNPRLREKLSYDFSETTLTVSGQSFTVKVSLETLHKVALIRKWLFIFQTPQVANPIPPEYFTKDDLKELKALLAAKGVRNNL